MIFRRTRVVLLVSAAFLSFGGWYIRRHLRRYTLSPI